MLPTDIQAAPVESLEEWLLLELSTLVVFEPKAFPWVLLHEAFTNGLAVLAESGWIVDWIL